MAKYIKTRNSVNNIKVLDKSVSLSSRMKNAFIRTKAKAEETQESRHSSPVDYADGKVQDTAEEAVRESVYQAKSFGKRLLLRGRNSPKTFKDIPQTTIRRKTYRIKTVEKAVADKRVASPAGSTPYTPKNLPPNVSRASGKLPRVKIVPENTTKIVAQPNAVKLKGQSPKVNPAVKPVSVKTVSPGERFKVIKAIADKTPLGKLLQRNSVLSNAFNPESSKLLSKSEKPKQNGLLAPKTPEPSKNMIAASAPHKQGNIQLPSISTAPQNVTDKPQKAAETPTKMAKSTKKVFKDTAKGTVKTTAKSIKTGGKTAAKTTKVAQKTAQTAAKAAKAAKASKVAAKTASVAAKNALEMAKATAKAVATMIKISIAAIKGLVTTIAAGGSVAVLVILIICLIGLLVGSIFGIFFSGQPSQSGGRTINSVIAEIDREYMAEIDSIIDSNPHDLLDMSGARASWKEVLAVYTVKTVNDPENPMDVATVDDERAALLRSVFWEMNVITHSVESYDVEEDVLDDNGIPTGETVVVTKTVLRITVSHKTLVEMADLYGFGDEQKAQLEELLKSDYYALWNSLLYGITSVGDGSIVEVAATQIGNVGGEPYWSWYGFSGRVEWCACFVSWCADVCGYIEAGIIPKFASCVAGEQWFKGRGQWQERGYTPRTGDIIFFDWNGNGVTQHVGIVESVTDGRVNTIEGNTSDTCARRSYSLDSRQIYGYGIPAY